MATAMKKNTTKKTTSQAKTSASKKVEEVKVERKKFAPDDLIPCLSITPGEMFFIGPKTDELYSWADLNDVVEVEYQDLHYATRRKDTMLFKPRFIVQDDDFVAENPALGELYDQMYSTEDLKDILDMEDYQIKEIVGQLPLGAQDALKIIVMTEIDSGRYTDIKKIKAFDGIFHTNMLSKAMNL